ncbi:MAG: ribbon-helix-helix protein, CopG family [Nitrososphaerota archaeon]
MGKLITISAKVDEELKKKAEKLGINISVLVRKALEEEIKKLELKNFINKLEQIKKANKLPSGTIVKIIREMREEIEN